MGSCRQGILIFSAICLGVTAAVLVNLEPSTRLIPADVLRDFPGRCYSWTSQKWYNPNDTWSLKPFCGASRCVALRNTKTNKTFLGEEVNDCGPLVDTEKSPDCKQVEDQFDTEADFPACCPVYDCPEGTEVFYVQKAGSEKAPRKLEK